MEVALRRENGETLCERCVLADTALARMRGLLGRKALPAGEGILLRPASSVHTGFMRFPIDVVFLDDENRVLKIAHALAPWKAAAARKAKAAVELPAGESQRHGLDVGEKLYVGDEPAAERRRRTLPWVKVGTNMLLASIWLAFAAANLADWRHTGRPVGLGMMMLELIIGLLFFVRRDPWVTSRAPLAWISTTIGGWGMLAARPHFAPVLHLDLVWFTMQVAGALAAAVSLGVLGRSFGLVAANRGVRTAGPYRIVRHPAYASYFFTDVGYTLENPSVRNVALLALVLSFQLARIHTEEDCLRSDPAYRRYCERVRYRLVPYFW
jgi:uncharacterized membrane protein (UPF0127 family)/protein-S-isoprenylcysteine O-methyltransferase Ste14